MTPTTPADARFLADEIALQGSTGIARKIRALADQVEALTKERDTLQYEVDAIPAIKAERDAQAKAADHWIAEATRDHNALVTLRKERDALMADAERYRGFRAALMADDDAFIDRAANEIPDENVPITAAMVDLAFDAALAAQRSKNI